MPWIDWMKVAFGVAIIGAVVYLAVRGWVKYPKERGKGGLTMNSQIPGAPPILFDRDSSKKPDVPTIVIPGEKSRG